jgi:hypothetical protein
LVGLGRRRIDDHILIIDCLYPKGEWKIGMDEHTPCTLHQSSVSALSNPILVGVVRGSLLMLDALFSKSSLKLLVDVLSTIITSKIFDRRVGLIGDKCVPLEEERKKITLFLQEAQPTISGGIIDKGGEIFHSTKRGGLHGLTQISVDVFQ